MTTTIADRRSVRSHELSPELQRKLGKIMAIKAKRDDLRRVQQIAAEIERSLEAQLVQARRLRGADEPWLLQQARLLRCELDVLNL